MKKVNFSSLMKLTWALLLSLTFIATSCKDDEPEEPPVIVLDGLYIKGGATALTDFDAKGMLKATRNEVTQTDRAELMEIYIAVKAGSPGFNIVSVAGSVQTTYGPGADFAVVPEAARNTDEPKVDFWRGSYTESTTAFTVPADGLYHVVLDKELKKIVIAPVVWGVIGAATPIGWNGSTALVSKGFDLNSMTFELTNLVLTKADFKFRYSDGWKIILDENFDLGGGNKGIKVNTNYGGAVDALVPGGANISNTVPGKYTASVKWTLGTGTTATLTKTGDLDLIDYTNTELGLVGNGLMVGGVQHNWDETVMLSKPVVENETNYTWTYNQVEVTAAGSFKIREGQDWSKKSVGYNDVTMAGLAADKFTTNGDGNFVPTEDGTYDIVFKIDAVTEKYTFTVNPAGAAPEMFMLGDGCTAGWNNASPLPMLKAADGIYYISTSLLGAGKYIKFITTPGQWAPMYGTDAAGTATGGNLVYRATESDPDPASIPCPATEGKYIVTINTNNLTYTIAPALYMLGDGCAAGWDNNAAISMAGGGNGVYYLTTNLGAGLSIKFITTLGAWEPMYGTVAGAVPASGTLVYRAPGDPDPANIPTPATAGVYTVTADITNLTYTITAKK